MKRALVSSFVCLLARVFHVRAVTKSELKIGISRNTTKTFVYACIYMCVCLCIYGYEHTFVEIQFNGLFTRSPEHNSFIVVVVVVFVIRHFSRARLLIRSFARSLVHSFILFVRSLVCTFASPFVLRVQSISES